MSQLTDMLRRHEDSVRHVYVCSAGYETIGVGRNISESGLGLSDGEIDFLLKNDIARVEAELEAEYSWFKNLDRVRKDAMIDISFNLGATRLRGFKKSLALIETGDYSAAAQEFLDSRWADQVGNRAIEVTTMIETGEYQNASA